MHIFCANVIIIPRIFHEFLFLFHTIYSSEKVEAIRIKIINCLLFKNWKYIIIGIIKSNNSINKDVSIICQIIDMYIEQNIFYNILYSFCNTLYLLTRLHGMFSNIFFKFIFSFTDDSVIWIHLMMRRINTWRNKISLTGKKTDATWSINYYKFNKLL